MKPEGELNAWVRRQDWIWTTRFVVLLLPVIIGLALGGLSFAIHGKWPRWSEYSQLDRDYLR